MPPIDPHPRRDFLKKAAIGAGVAWTAPVVTSMSAMAQTSQGGPTPQGVGNPCICLQPNSTGDTGGFGGLGLVAGDTIIAAVAQETDGGGTALSLNVTSIVTDTALSFTRITNSTVDSREQTGQTRGVITELWYVTIPVNATVPTSATLTRTSSGRMSVCMLRVTAAGTIALENPGNGVNDSGNVESSTTSVGAVTLATLSTAVAVTMTRRGHSFVADTADGYLGVNSDVINGSASGCGASYPDIFFQYRRFATGGSSGVVNSEIRATSGQLPLEPAYWTATLPEISI